MWVVESVFRGRHLQSGIVVEFGIDILFQLRQGHLKQVNLQHLLL